MIPNLATGESLAQDAINNAGPLGIKYIIFNHRVWNPRQGWHPYTSTSNPHTDHVHITFNDSPGTGSPGGDIPAGGSVSTPTQGISFVSDVDNDCAWGIRGTCVASKVAVRVGLGGGIVLVGGGIVILGLVMLIAYGLDKNDTVRAALKVGAVL
jgi:hypothetical protein